MSTRLSITLLLCGLVSSVLFGIGATTVLSIPSLSVHAAVLLPIVVVASFVMAPVICWFVAPILRSRFARQDAASQLLLEKPAHSHD